MVKKKIKSKRETLKHKYKVLRKVKDHARKERRDARKNPNKRKKLSKDPGIPNLCPFKEDLINRMRKSNERVKEYAARNRKARQDQMMHRRLSSKQQMQQLATAAQKSAEEFSHKAASDAVGAGGAKQIQSSASRVAQSTRRAYYRHLKKIVESADIVLEVLDARDPLGCRAKAVESLLLAQDPPKRIILVLNKIDLVPAPVVKAWLAHLRREFPTIAFKASTQEQRSKLSGQHSARVTRAAREGVAAAGKGAAGRENLMNLIKNYMRNQGIKTAVSVGVIGYPNVGKSSIINSLTFSKSVGVSPKPGYTTMTQEVSLEAKVKLIDCPGIIFDEDEGGFGAGLLLKNCISVGDMDDPEGAVAGILARCAPEKLMSLYSIPKFANADEFLALVARKRGKIKKGGVFNKAEAARSVLQDWNAGKVPFFTLPPAKQTRVSANAAIVTKWSQEFSMDKILKAEEAGVLMDLAPMQSADFVSVEAREPAEAAPLSLNADSDEDAMSATSEAEDGVDSGDDDEDAMEDIAAPPGGGGAGGGAGAGVASASSTSAPHTRRMFKQGEAPASVTAAAARAKAKKAAKREKKARKAAALAGAGASADAAEDYDFDADFSY